MDDTSTSAADGAIPKADGVIPVTDELFSRLMELSYVADGAFLRDIKLFLRLI